MAVTFNTNVSALTAQRYMSNAGDAAASSLSKLSSGSRVPTAKDDAAGLAIGTKLKAEVAGLQQAGNNAAQAISLLQIADGALSTVSDVLQRMKSLAVQASSGQLSNADRGLLNQEFQNLKSEVNRIANITNFNGTKLLQGGGNGAVLLNESRLGGLSSRGLEVAVNADVATSGNVFRISYDHVAGTAYDGSTATTAATTGGDDQYNVTVTNLTTGQSQTINVAAAMIATTGSYDPGTAGNLATGEKIDVDFTTLGVKVTLNERFDRDTDFNVDLTDVAAIDGTDGATTAFTQTDTTYTLTAPGSGFDNDDLNAIKALSNYDAATGRLTFSVVAATNGGGDDTYVLDQIDGLQYQLNAGAVGANHTDLTLAQSAATGNATTTNNLISVYLNGGVKIADIDLSAVAYTGANSTTATSTFSIELPRETVGQTFTTGSAVTSFDFKVGTGTTDDDSISFDLTAVRSSDLGISTSVISTAADADAAIGTINTAIATVASRRADVGAAQSRLQFASDSIAVAIENTSSAQSAIMDVDVSSEITTFTSKQVLLQAGVSLLAQANQQPALLLRLLQ